MRLQLEGNAGDHEFSTNLLNLGNGKITDVDCDRRLIASLHQIVPLLEKLIKNYL